MRKAPKVKKAKSKNDSTTRAKKYEEKLQINGSFEDLLQELITPDPQTQSSLKYKK